MQELEKLQKLQELVDQSRKIVFFGGAGVSTEAESRTSAVWMGFTISIIPIRQR